MSTKVSSRSFVGSGRQACRIAIRVVDPTVPDGQHRGDEGGHSPQYRSIFSIRSACGDSMKTTNFIWPEQRGQTDRFKVAGNPVLFRAAI